MLNQSNVMYRYDGSFEGLLCCVFESYDKKEVPADIISPSSLQNVLLPTKDIWTDSQKAERVLTSISPKMGKSALELIQHAFLTCFPQKELYILLFLRLGYRHGSKVMTMLTEEVVDTLCKAVKHLERESHLLKGFLRFSIIKEVLIGEIEPKNYVLPLLVQHFCERYPEERFLIYDKTHNMALVYQPYQPRVIPIDSLEIPEADEEEQAFRKLWRVFYDAIEIQGRHNPKCRMNHMPKRYWEYMTEFSYGKNRTYY